MQTVVSETRRIQRIGFVQVVGQGDRVEQLASAIRYDLRSGFQDVIGTLLEGFAGVSLGFRL